MKERDEVVSYRKLRSFIGITGLALPIILVVGCWVGGAGWYSFQPSISDYYYSYMHIAFVGLLCVLGGFFVTYKGKTPAESKVSNFAGACAFGVAAFPTRPADFRSNGHNQYLQLCTDVSGIMGFVHYLFAALLLASFVVFCLWFFQTPDSTCKTIEAQNKFARRKRIYTLCGYGIVASLLIIILFGWVIKKQGGLFTFTTFIFETTALWFFGIAWLVKGSAMWMHTPVMRSLVKPLRAVSDTPKAEE